MLRTAASAAASMLSPKSVLSEGIGGLVGLFMGALFAVLLLTLPAFMAVQHFTLEKELNRWVQAPEKSIAVDVAKFYKAVIPQAAFDAYATLPSGKLQRGEPGYRHGVGFGADLQNAKWGVLAAYFVAAWVFFALQVAIMVGFMFLLGRVWMPLMYVPVILLIAHFALPLYLSSHFKYMQYMAQ